MYKHFRKEPVARILQCNCGGKLRLINRRNFTHGRKSVATYSAIYKCNDCNTQKRASKPAPFKR